MATESEKRIAALAVSRYGADRVRVRSTYQAVQAARAQGRGADLLDMLVADNILTASQVDEIRLDLNGTATDPAQIAVRVRPDPGNEETAPLKTSAGNGSPPPAPTASGYVLRSLGEFQLLRRLGQGGMGSVYLAYQKSQDRQVAIKVMSDQLAGDPSYVERFHREAKSGSRLNHPNLVRCMDAGKDEGSGKHYLVMEYVDGFAARALIDRYGRLSAADALHIVLDIAKALEHIHARNYVHRDIKPDNILITKSGVAKLADLGLAKCTDDSTHLTALRQGFGTMFYMPYEQAINAKGVDGRSDIYALGATLYHLLTGEVPFPGNNHLEIAEKKLIGKFASASLLNPSVNDELNQILDRMMAPKREDRYQTASELIVDLERTKLAAAVPSFVDREHAMQDPVVVARLAAAAQATQLDVSGSEIQAPAVQTATDFWYLRYRDAKGQWCKSRGSLEQVKERIQSGWLPQGLEACPPGQDEFKPLGNFPEFKAVLMAWKEPKVPDAAGQDAKAAVEVVEVRTKGAFRRWAAVLFAAISALFLSVVGAVVYFLATR